VAAGRPGGRVLDGDVPIGPQIVPKGLRAFGREDAGSFLDLLPGPRDRNGLPESIRFWKNRLEERDGDETFAVGLLYGPSGCGKSSLVRAGLLPRLAEGIVAVCVDALPDETGPRIMQALRKRLPTLPAELGLVETLASIRRGGGPKVVVVLDQFEQWLHAHGGDPESELVDALRHCDGGRLQSVIMVRDDFAMAATRFMHALDIPIVQGHNFATLDLFDVEHARLVLTRFGQAFGKLPTGPTGPSAAQRRFVNAVASGLARDGKIVPVRLALFAEMVKARPWVPATLSEAGGTEGIGANFLEETFRSRSANPEYHPLERAARNVLKTLLPEVGSDIKGNMRSYWELREASGLRDRPGDFAALLRVLDGELRLISPTDPPESPTDAGGGPGAKYWQLTHDYLVPSLREWLNRKQKETRRGRAELRLEERAAFWSARREPRHLPTLREWLRIRVLTDRGRWTGPQREMMRRAGRLHGLRLAVTGALSGALLAGALAVVRHNEGLRRQARADALVEQLLVADLAGLPDVAGSLAREPTPTAPRLRAVADDPGVPRERRLRAAYALAERPGDAASQLVEFASSANPDELAVIRDRLAPYAPALAPELWDVADRRSSDPLAQLRIAALLAVADGVGDRWRDLARPVVNTLLTLETLDLEAWAELLRPASGALTPGLRERFFDASAISADRVNAARALARFAGAELFADLLFEAEASQFAMLFPAVSRHHEGVIEAARGVLDRWEEGAAGNLAAAARRTRNAAITLLRLGEPGDAEPLLSTSEDPTARTMVILEMRDFGVPPDLLLDLTGRCKDPAARQALLLALGPYQAREWSPAARRALSARMAGLIRDGRHQAERSAAEWLLRRWGDEGAPVPGSIPPPGEAILPTGPVAGRDWWVTAQGHTMAVLDAPAALAGAPDGPGSSGPDRAAPFRFALSVHEVTIDQFRRFKPDADFRVGPDPAAKEVPDALYPANMVTFTDALRYCRWLSEQEEVPDDQMCYPPAGEIEPRDALLSDERRRRTGYRLPIEGEWELAAAAGSKTPWSSGTSAGDLTRFAWFAVNSGEHLQRVGMLLPNPLGLFDAHGNASEWCHSASSGGDREGKFVLRGGYYSYSARYIRSSHFHAQPNIGYSFTGFRVARTVAAGQ
jgi:formylglycine-generating enzyme required for sulfatase activity